MAVPGVDSIASRLTFEVPFTHSPCIAFGAAK